MKKRKTIVILCLAAALLLTALTGCGAAEEKEDTNYIHVDSESESSVTVTARGMKGEGGALAYITVREGQSLVIRTDLSDKSAVSVKIRPLTEADTSIDSVPAVSEEAEYLVDETFSGAGGEASYELPAGEYALWITGANGTDGRLTITAE